ncbi:MAG: hypothetical protein ACRDHP_17895, partial [Ktedonobacterales bacterium]
VLMCSCTGILATVANAAFAGAGGSGTASCNGNTGTKQLGGAETFPTFTVPPYTVATIPAGSIPDSQTPAPGPSATPTDLPATPTDTPSGGPPPQGACSGNSGGATWQFSPCPQSPGQSGSVIVVDPAYAGHGVNAVVSFGVCPTGISCTVLYTPNLGYHFDGSGRLVLPYTIPAQAQTGAAPESGMVNINGGPTVTFTGPDLQ